jgi:hypothetical protein
MDYLDVDVVPNSQRICAISLATTPNGIVGFKVRGTYKTIAEAREAIVDSYHDIYITNTGYWCVPPGTELSTLNHLFEMQGLPAFGPIAVEGVAPVDVPVPAALTRRYKNHIVQYLDTSKLDPCAICHGTLNDISVLPCLHMFCKTCVEPLTCCPVCRSLF